MAPKKRPAPRPSSDVSTTDDEDDTGTNSPDVANDDTEASHHSPIQARNARNIIDDTSGTSSQSQLISQASESSDSELSEFLPPLKTRKQHKSKKSKKKHHSPEYEICHFHGASGKIVSFGTTMQISLKGKRQM